MNIMIYYVHIICACPCVCVCLSVCLRVLLLHQPLLVDTSPGLFPAVWLATAHALLCPGEFSLLKPHRHWHPKPTPNRLHMDEYG